MEQSLTEQPHAKHLEGLRIPPPESTESPKDNSRNSIYPTTISNPTMAFSAPTYEAYPNPESPEQSTMSHTQKGFKISARKLPISKSGPIDDMSKTLGIPVPEMIFGDNMVSIEHLESGWRMEFNAYDALDKVDKTDKNMLKVAYSQEWSASRLVLRSYARSI